jgi:hypothetical protein
MREQHEIKQGARSSGRDLGHRLDEFSSNRTNIE